VRLDIVVAPGCDEARAVARAVQEQLPALRVSVIGLDERRPPPERVVATPTYLLDGAVVSLGNPRGADLIRTIQRRASQRVPGQRGADGARPGEARPPGLRR
jgi:hypothetical protein